jgi:protein Tex
LAKPGRDPRREFENFRFAEGIEKIEDLRPGMKLDGIVTNVTAFGAFVDVGVHQDGLVHVSHLSDRFVKDPHQVVKVHQQVKVSVLSIDLERKRIALSLKKDPDKTQGRSKPQGRPPVEKNAGERITKRNEPFNNPFAKLFRREE